MFNMLFFIVLNISMKTVGSVGVFQFDAYIVGICSN